MLTSNQEPPVESRIDKMRKFLSSPLTRKKSSVPLKTFGTPLEILLQKGPSEHSVPFVITRLCQYILKTGLTHEGLFRISGNARSVERLKTSFDRSGDAPLETEGDVPSAAALLKLFLRELPDPIIPLAMHCQFLDAVKDKEKVESIDCLTNLVEKLPAANYNILNYLFSFLKQVSAMEEQNRMSASSLGIVFGPNLFRVTEDFVGLKEQSLTNQIVTLFISEHAKIFCKEAENFTCNTCFSTSIHKTNQVSAMVSSWPEAKCSSAAMLSTWSLGPIPVQNDSNRDEFLSLSSLSHSLAQTQNDFMSVNYHNPAFTVNSEPKSFMMDASDFSSPVHRELLMESNSASSLIHKNLTEPKIYLGKESTLKEYYMMEEESLLSHSSIRDCSPNFSGNDQTFTSYEKDTHAHSSLSSQDSVSFSEHSAENCSNHHEKMSQESNEEMLMDTHKIYPRGRRRHSRSQKAKEHLETQRRSQSELRTSNHFKDEDEFNGNSAVHYMYDKTDVQHNSTGSLDESGAEMRHSWPAFRKCREEEDIALSPLPQQLGISIGEASVSPSAFRSYLSHRNLHLDPNLPPSPPVEQEDIVPGNSHETTTNTKQLVKKVHGLKKKIKLFEENFEKLYGYKPSHTDKSSNIAVKKMIAELNQARQDLRDLKEDPLLFEMEELTQNKSTKATNTRSSQGISQPKHRTESISIEESIKNALAYLTKQRNENSRPEDLEEMNKEQLVAEKVAIQKVLLNFESLHGRPGSKVHRELVRPLYDRYRFVKRLIARTSTSKENADLMPILEHETMDFKGLDLAQNINVQNVSETKEEGAEKVKTEQGAISSHINFHELSLSELEAQVNVVRDEKRRLRKILREFEEQFKKEHGRKVQREDKRSMESCYTEYKNAKAKLKLLEALVAKYEQTS